jgi:diketogulonate reductase-like aldo/keto reductase
VTRSQHQEPVVFGLARWTKQIDAALLDMHMPGYTGIEILPILIAERMGLTPSQASLLWVKDQPGVTAPIIGPRTPAQLAEMLEVAGMQAGDDLCAAFDSLNPPGMAVSNFHNTSGWMKATVLPD